MAATAAQRLALPTISSFVSSTDNNVILLKGLMNASIQQVKNEFPWPELTKEYTFTLSSGVASYALPSDFNTFVAETYWNRTSAWPITSVNSSEWQGYKSGLIASIPRQRFRIKGITTKQFFVDPTPGADDDGDTVVFEYISNAAVVARTWSASLSVTGSRYVTYEGNTYDRGGTGAATTGSTPPTHTTGSASDGSITWTYSALNQELLSLSDDYFECVLDNEMIVTDLIWRFKREREFDYKEHQQEAMRLIEDAKTALIPAEVVSIHGNRGLGLPIGPWSYPEGNYGL